MTTPDPAVQPAGTPAAAATRAEEAVQAPAAAARPAAHSLIEDVLAVATGSVLIALGILLVGAAGAVTGGTPGLALLLARALDVPFAATYALVSLPFLVLAAVRLGLAFTVRTVVAVGAVAGLSSLHEHVLTLTSVSVGYGTVVGNLLVGVGLIVLFRHGTSLGGFGVLALLAQERLGWRAGWVQLALDGAVVLAAVVVAPAVTVALSAAGAVLLNVVIALNHRPGRYLA